MSGIFRRLNGRFTRAAVGPQLSYGAVRTRLTLIYGGLFVLSGAALMAIAYLLLVNAGFVFTLQPGATTTGGIVPKGAFRVVGGTPGSFPNAGRRTHPSAQTMAYWRGVAGCMREHGVAGFPSPTDRFPLNPGASGTIGQMDDRDGAILVFRRGLDMQSSSFTSAAGACGFYADNSRQFAQQNNGRTQVRADLVLQSGIALAAMSLLSLGLGWFVAGRVLEPLEASYEAQRQFVANASHELRAPLTRQRALIQVALADPHASEESLRAAHERALAAEQHLEEMIAALLTLTRGQAGLERSERIDLAAIASAVVSAHEGEAKDLALTVHTSLDPAPAQGDPRLIERLLANVIANAIRHNVASGRVQITTGTRDRVAFVSVANTGPVVGEEHLERLFRPFERLGTARTGHDSGHGLGLSIVRAIADAHRAELSVLPQPDGGLIVEVAFPAARSRTRVRRRAGLGRTAPRTTLGD